MGRLAISRRKALIASMGLFALPSCASQLSGTLPSSRVPQGSVRRYRTQQFPVTRPDGTTPPLKLGANAGETTQSVDYTVETYEGLTAYVYTDESYAEFYDSSGNLQLQATLSFSSSENTLTVSAVGPDQSVTATTPNIADVLSAGAAQIGSSSGSFDESTSSASVTDATTGLTTQQVVVSATGTATINPPDSLPSLSIAIPIDGSGTGCVDGRCLLAVHPESGIDCLAMILAVLLLVMVLADLAVDGGVAVCADPLLCAAYWAFVVYAMEQLTQLEAALVAESCTQ